MGDVRFRARAARPLAECAVPGGGMLLRVGDDEYVLAGRNLGLTFEPTAAELHTTEIVWADVGRFEAGRWIPGRRLNGDETWHGTGIRLREELEHVGPVGVPVEVEVP